MPPSSTILRLLSLSFVLVVSNTSVPCFGQERPARPEEVELRHPISFESIPIFDVDNGQARVNIHYRIGQRFFVFVRNPESTREEFIARGELMVEIRDNKDITVGREIRQILLKRTALPGEREQLPDIQGAFSFPVADGEYRIVFGIDDRESGRSFLNRDRTVTTRRVQPHTFELSYPIFSSVVIPQDDNAAFEIVPFNRGNSVLFGGAGGYAFQIQLPPEKSLSVRWNLEGRRDAATREQPSFSGTEYTAMAGVLLLSSLEGRVVYTITPSVNLSWRVLFIPLPLQKLEPGQYKVHLEVDGNGSRVTRDHTFNVIWPNRPISLSNFQLAVDALQHIATEKELSEMQSGGLERGMRAFRAFWRERDPDTTTAYNEVMVEYYRRVDETIERFSSQAGRDGYKTDRGRIFILYGSPTRAERLIPPGGLPTEVWTYDHLKRRFIFTDRSRSGNLMLTAIEDL